MTVPGLIRFVEEGSYLNVYEFVARDTGLAGEELEAAVVERPKEFGPLRLKLDGLFGFQRDTHYASFNLGGSGARRYGACCVVFDLCHWAPYHTCFAGDSIRACCSPGKKPLLADEKILASFGTGSDLDRLAIIRHERFLERQVHSLDPGEVRDILEADDSLFEIHLHGPVTRERIQEVRLSRADYHHLRDLEERAKGLAGALPWEFDGVEPFRALLAVLDRFDVPLVLAEGG
ncbi:MAG TPA: hypothetical protein VF173_00425 [Thermoanaerobaculia bacterium]|nr:hypothetical protein [Thermoanaerobaculia bacterium]